jgi:hypothetical protein
VAFPDLDKLSFRDIPDPAAQILARPPSPEPASPVEPSPTRAERQRLRLAAILATPAWIALAALVLGLRGDLRDASVLLKIALWSALGLFALWVMLRPRARGLPPGARAVMLCLGAVPLFYGIAVLALPRSSAPISIGEVTFSGCAVLSVVFAAGPLALAGVLLKRTFLSIPSARGAAIGAICGLAGAIGLHTHCPVETTVHLLLMHGTGIFVCALIGAIFGALHGRA